MAIPWAQVAASPEYQKLDGFQKEAARKQYFDQVVAPQVPSADIEKARAQFNAQTEWQPRYHSPGELKDRSDQIQRDDNPTMQGIGTGQRLVEGASKSVVDTGLGLKQLGVDALDYVAPLPQTTESLVTGVRPTRGAAVQAQIDQHARQDDALMRTPGGAIGDVGGQVAQLFIPGADAGKLVTYAGKGAPLIKAAVQTGAFAATQPVQSGQTRAGNMAEASALGAFGQAGAKLTRAAAGGMVSRMKPVAGALARKAESYGIPLSAAQLSNNPLVRTIASQMERLPFSGARKANEARQNAFNRALGKTFGVNVDKITPEVFDHAQARIGQVFDSVSARNRLPASPQLLADLGGVVDEAKRLGGTDTAVRVQKWTDELLSKADKNGNIPGAAFQSFRSRLGKELGAGGEVAHYLGIIRDVASSHMDAAISPRDRAAWDLARKQYAALKAVEPLVAKSAAGDISPQALMGRVTANRGGKARMARGRGGEQGDLARIGQRFLRAAPDSGTADRMLVNATLGGSLYGAQHYGLIDPDTAVAGGAMLLGNRLALGALNSRGMTYGGGRVLNGLARLAEPAPKVLTAAGLTLARPKPKKDEKR